MRRPQIPDKLRIALGEKFLAWSEGQSLRGRAFARLKPFREQQYREAERCHAASRPPSDTELDFIGITLIDVYFSEESDRLRDALIKFFPDLDSQLSSRTFIADFQRQANNIAGGAWWNVGVIVRDPKGRLFGQPRKVMTALPPEVDFIEVWLYKVLPSLFVISLNVYLDDCAAQRLAELQDRRYLSEVRFHHLIPFGNRQYGLSATVSDFVMKKSIEAWREQLRAKVESCLSPLLTGQFGSSKSEDQPKLPALELYALRGVQEDSFAAWQVAARGWWASLGFGFHFLPEVFTDGKLVFVAGSSVTNSSRNHRVPHRTLALREPYVRSISLDGYGGDDRFAIWHTIMQGITIEMLPVLAIDALLDDALATVGALRQDVFQSVARGHRLVGRVRRSLSLPIMLNDEVLRASVLHDRIARELKQDENRMRREMAELDGLKPMQSRNKESVVSLRDAALTTLWFKADLLQVHTSMMRDWLSQTMTLRNTTAMYILAFVATLASVVGIIGLSNLHQFLREVVAGIASLIR